MRILVGVPTTGLMDHNFVSCLLALASDERFDVVFEVGSLIHESRGKLAVAAISGGYDYLLFIDSDMTFTLDDVERLIDHGDDIVGANYLKRSWTLGPTAHTFFPVEGEGAAELPPDLAGRHKVDALGTGFMLIAVPALTKIILHAQCNPFNFIGAIGEDYSFCKRAQDAGFRVYADNDLNVGHLAQFVVTRRTAPNLRKATMETAMRDLFRHPA